MTPYDFIYQYAMRILQEEERLNLCARLLSVEPDILKAWLTRRANNQP